MVGEFKRRGDYWQKCAAAAHALADIEQPVNDSYREANANRQATQQTFEEVSAWFRQRRDWPPTSVTLEAERQEMERVEAQWQAIKSNNTKAIHLVQQLGNLSAKYQTLAEKARQSTEHAAQEMSQIEELEAELNELAQLWQNQWYSYRQEAEVSKEIRGLLDEIDHQMELAKRQYKQKSRNYSQIQQSLKALHRKMRYYQVALDADHAVDVNGNVNRRR
jgi:DNA repair exonuclease SbcCD ATPase subunit